MVLYVRFAKLLVPIIFLMTLQACTKQEEAPSSFEDVTGTINIGIRSELTFEEEQSPPALPEVEPSTPIPAKPDDSEKRTMLEPAKEIAKSSVVSSYKTDPEYARLKRYERPWMEGEIDFSLEVEVTQDYGKTVRLIDRPLVFAGKGFDIQEFESKSKNKLDFNYEKHLEEPFPIPQLAEKVEHLDPKGRYARHDKDMIFHPARPFGPVPPIEEEKTSPQTRKKSPEVESVPETLVLLGQDKETLIVLQPREDRIDLLMGNENLNKDAYQN